MEVFTNFVFAMLTALRILKMIASKEMSCRTSLVVHECPTPKNKKSFTESTRSDILLTPTSKSCHPSDLVWLGDGISDFPVISQLFFISHRE